MIIDIDPEYPPSRLISYSVSEAIGQVNITHMIFHKNNACSKEADIEDDPYGSNSCSTFFGSLNLTTQAGFLTYRSSLGSPSHMLRTYNGYLSFTPCSQ